MNYLYERMEAAGETAIFDRAELKQFEKYVADNYEDFYKNNVSYESRKEADKFIITLFNNPVITMEEILLDIKD